VKLVIAAVSLSLVLTACSRGYEAENRRIVDELPKVAGLTLVKKSFDSGCSQDTCQFGNDRSFATVAFTVDTNALTQQQVIDAYVAALDDWAPTISERCGNADPSFCDKLTVVSFTRGDARISLDFLSWRVGRFAVGVDARGG
jgi:hypothetical protein